MLRFVADTRPLPEPYWVAKAERSFLDDAKSHPDLVVVIDAFEALREHWRRMRDLADRAIDPRVREALVGRYGLADSGRDAALDLQCVGWDWRDDREGR